MRVVELPLKNVGWVMRAMRNGMLGLTPRIRNSCKHRSIRAEDSASVRPRAVTLTSRRIIKGIHYRTAKCAARIQANAHTASTSIVGDAAVVGTKLVGRIFRGKRGIAWQSH